jgi:hypothetical protein
VVTSDWILLLNGIAILLAPVVALRVGGILQRRSDAQKSKLTLFGTLIALRHTPLSTELIRALNLIDAVFADDPVVREAWTQYLTALNNQSLNTDVGLAIREDKRHNLLLQIVKALKLSRKISSADLLRIYTPTFVAEDTRVAWLERLYKSAMYEEELSRRHIDFPRSPFASPSNSAYSPNPSHQPSGPSAGNGGEPITSATPGHLDPHPPASPSPRRRRGA